MEELLKLLRLKQSTEGQAAQPTQGLLGNTNALIGLGLLAGGAKGQNIFEAGLPSVLQAAQIQKLATPKMGALKQAYDPKNKKVVFASNAEIRQKGLVPVPTPKEEIEYLPGGGFRMTKGGTPTPQSQKDLELARNLANSNFQFNNVANRTIDLLKKTKIGGVGAIISTLDTAGSQIKQAANSFGIAKDYTSDNPELIDSIIQKDFNLAKDAQNYEIFRSNIVNLAFMMAKSDEPGGRFSDKDIALRMRQLGVGGNPKKTAAVIENVSDIINQNANRKYQSLTGKNLPGFEERKKKEDEQIKVDPLGLGL